jgi:hypothetical protein
VSSDPDGAEAFWLTFKTLRCALAILRLALGPGCIVWRNNPTVVAPNRLASKIVRESILLL